MEVVMNPARLARLEKRSQVPTDVRKAYTIAQFLSIYGLGRTRLYEELDSGRLASYSVGRRRFISAAAADTWQAALEAESNLSLTVGE